MSKKLLVQYVKLMLEADKNARVPNQLIAPEGDENEDSGNEAEDVVEFSGCAGVAGVVTSQK